jgi:hypothetical protein
VGCIAPVGAWQAKPLRNAVLIPMKIAVNATSGEDDFKSLYQYQLLPLNCDPNHAVL